MIRGGNVAIPVADLVVDDSVQVREFLSEPAVKRYSEAMEMAVRLPPLNVCKMDDGSLVVVDGHQRLEAAKRIGADSIECKVWEGDIHAARLQAAIANAKHGLPLSDGDKKRAIVQAWEAWPKATGGRPTHRQIAEHVGCSHVYVGRILDLGNQLPKSGSCCRSDEKTDRVKAELEANKNRTDAEIAEAAGCGVGLVGRKRKELGAQRTDKPNAKKAAQTAALERKLLAGTSDKVESLATEFGLSVNTVSKVRKRLGLDRDSKSKREHRPEQHDQPSPKLEEQAVESAQECISAIIERIDRQPIDLRQNIANAVRNHYDHRAKVQRREALQQEAVH